LETVTTAVRDAAFQSTLKFRTGNSDALGNGGVAPGELEGPRLGIGPPHAEVAIGASALRDGAAGRGVEANDGVSEAIAADGSPRVGECVGDGALPAPRDATGDIALEEDVEVGRGPGIALLDILVNEPVRSCLGCARDERDRDEAAAD
jgi:hypothetical protein